MSTARERTQEWLDSQQDELESIAESSVVDSLDDYKYSEHTFTEQEDDDDDDEETGEEVSTIALGTRTVGESVSISCAASITYLYIFNTNILNLSTADSKGTIIRDTLRDLLNSINSIQTVGNVNISNSTNVHIGNVTNINGNIQIIAEAPPTPRPRNMRRERRKVSSTDAPNVDEEEEEESEERVSSDVFINRQSN